MILAIPIRENRKTKYVPRQATRDLVPEEIESHRDKRGCSTPEAIWMREVFSDQVLSLLHLIGSVHGLTGTQNVLFASFRHLLTKKRHTPPISGAMAVTSDGL
ncbi:asparagine synthase-related protein [Methanocalculus taiwanensis]|uniref:asparagine synthase-related protein n=1 Tax=Methanocalculus taiwanensis TaxID=106207 RepID=UPI0034CE3D51